MTASSATPSSGSGATTRRPRSRAGRANRGREGRGLWLDKTRGAWERTANRALEQAGRSERIDHHSLAELRDEAPYRSRRPGACGRG